MYDKKIKLHTSAPSSSKVSMRTAVWTVMWRQPLMRAPFKGWEGPYLALVTINPGISFSASIISLRPHSAKLMFAVEELIEKLGL